MAGIRSFVPLVRRDRRRRCSLGPRLIMNETVGQTCHVRLSDIIVPPKRLRALRPGVVAQLADSMKAQGQLQPIVLRASEATGYYLVAGMHRLAAAKTLPCDSIWATVLEGLNADRA